jgi:hypothetical protein
MDGKSIILFVQNKESGWECVHLAHWSLSSLLYQLLMMMIMIVEHSVEWELARELKYLEKTSPGPILSTTNHTWPDLASNLGCCDRKLATYGMAQSGKWEYAGIPCHINKFCQCLGKGLSYPCGRLWRPIGLWDIQAPTFSRQLAHTWRWGCQPYAPAALYPPRKIPGTHFC